MAVAGGWQVGFLARSLGAMGEVTFGSETVDEAAPASAGGSGSDGAPTAARCPVRAPAGSTGTCPVRMAGGRSAEVRVRRFLRVPDGPPKVGDQAAQRLFSFSILLSALRCLLTYVALPILSPFLGVAGGVGPAVGIPLAVVALVFDVLGIRRFWLADHRWKWAISGIYLVVMGFVSALLVIEVFKLVA